MNVIDVSLSAWNRDATFCFPLILFHTDIAENFIFK